MPFFGGQFHRPLPARTQDDVDRTVADALNPAWPDWNVLQTLPLRAATFGFASAGPLRAFEH